MTEQKTDQKKRCLIIVNPCAGRRKGLRYLPKLHRFFDENGFSVTDHVTASRGDVTTMMTTTTANTNTTIITTGTGNVPAGITTTTGTMPTRSSPVGASKLPRSSPARNLRRF